MFSLQFCFSQQNRDSKVRTEVLSWKLNRTTASRICQKDLNRKSELRPIQMFHVDLWQNNYSPRNQQSLTSAKFAANLCVVHRAYLGTLELTLMKNPINVLSVKKHLHNVQVWLYTLELTLVKNLINALSVKKHLGSIHIWLYTLELTLVKNPISALSVKKHLGSIQHWLYTLELTLMKNPINVLSVKKHSGVVRI